MVKFIVQFVLFFGIFVLSVLPLKRVSNHHQAPLQSEEVAARRRNHGLHRCWHRLELAKFTAGLP